MLTKVRWCSKSSDMVGTRHTSKKTKKKKRASRGTMAERGAETQTRVNQGDEVELERLAEAPPQKPAYTRKIEVDGRRRREERERTRSLK